jgi:nucleoid DNA-binding protein
VIHTRKPLEERSDYERLLLEVAIAEGITQKLARAIVEQFVARLPEVVWARGRFVVPNLGSFRVRLRKGRRIRNPKTRELMKLPKSRAVAVRVSNHWRSRG